MGEGFFKVEDLSLDIIEYYLDEATVIDTDILKKIHKHHPKLNLRRLYRKNVFEEEYFINNGIEKFKRLMMNICPPTEEDISLCLRKTMNL